MKYFDIKTHINKNPGCKYYAVVGQRSSGKTYSCLREGLERYFKYGDEIAYLRRWGEDFKGKSGPQLFEALVSNGEVEKLSGGKFTDIVYWSQRWYLAKKDSKGKLQREDKPFCYAFALTRMQHDKSVAFPNIRTVIFDEFLVGAGFAYLPNEFMMYCNTLSTIIRERDDVTIFMLANTVNFYNPYAEEMGWVHFQKMNPGDVDIYTYHTDDGRECKLCLIFDEGSSTRGKKASDVYFAFDNPQLNMITGKGTIWELELYPHLPCDYSKSEVLFTYFVKFDHLIYQCEIINTKKPDALFTYIHKKTTPIQDEDKDLVFTPDYDPRPNFERFITNPESKLAKKVVSVLGNMQNVYFQDNMTGLGFENYINWSKTNRK